ncbi:MAG: glutathione S-transferase family protein [Betaproteobacteria bacterium]|nr:glutathione S-transferase family protein [Betaproteobacteria bacterium]
MSNIITFYFGSGSPYAWKVWLALEHKKLPYEAKRMSFDNGDLKTPEFTAINPRQKVPALVDNGFAMYESAAILEYLEDRYPDSGERLWPRDVQARAIARRRAAEVVAYVDPINDKLFTELFGPAGKIPDVASIDASKQALTEELARIEGWLDEDYLAGGKLSGADFTLYPYLAFLGRVDTRIPGYHLLALAPPKVAAWMKRIESLPYFEKTVPPHWKA